MSNIMDLFSNEDIEQIDFNIQNIQEIYPRIAKIKDSVGGEPVLRAKVGAGGATFFTVTNGNREVTLQKFQGVIIAHHKSNALFPESEENMNMPPICASLDGIMGTVAETGECRECANCEHNVFGTAGKGKACKNMHRLYIISPDSPVPIILSIPPTSLEFWHNYALMDVAAANLDISSVVTEFSLTRTNNSNGQKYCVINFKKIGTVAPEVQDFCNHIGTTFEHSPRIELTAEEYNVETPKIEEQPDSEPDEISDPEKVKADEI